MAIKICMDAGHYGKINQSPVVKEYYEAQMNWKLHLLLKQYLEQYGFEVIQTRKGQDKDLSLAERGRASQGCDLFLSIHSNACDTESVDRPVVIVQLDGKGDELGKALGKCIQKTMQTKGAYQLYTKKGSNGGEYYGVLRGAADVGTIGMILEHSFHTNTTAAKWLLDERNLDKLAKAEAATIAAHYGYSKPEDEETAAPGVTVQLPVLQSGDTGKTVKAMQMLLIGDKYSCGAYGADGKFGTATDYAVRRFQRANSLEVDGICGPATWAKLLGVE